MYIADLHIHSKYSRATSGQCEAEFLDLWARRKGIGLIGTGDFTHPAWRKELHEKLVPAAEGLYTLREELKIADATAQAKPAHFVITGEISSIYRKNGKVRKVHNLILLPSLEAAQELSQKLEAIGNIHSDGRPILGLDSRDLLEITLEACPDAVFIPAHIWTPHFSMFGAFSGFDTIEECFEDMTPYIHAVETGLSSDPPMNWRLSALDAYTLVSNSDAHSPAKLGREANLLDTEMSYPALAAALREGRGKGFAGTVEFFPEEGKYHLDGHRNCHLCLQPSQTRELSGLCPVCGKKITIGVLNRVEQLADRPEGYRPADAPPFESLAPLTEVIAASTGMSAGGVKVQAFYEGMLQRLGPEFYILRSAPLGDIGRAAGACVQEGIRRLRCGEVSRTPGYDGEYGKIQILSKDEIDTLGGQVSLTGMDSLVAEKPKRTPARKVKPETVPAQQTLAGTQKAPTGPFDGLNQEQQQAVAAEERAVAVVAGPGTGKTRTLVARIAYLIGEKKVKPAQITAVTFTNRAAEELRERLAAALGSKRVVGAVKVGTFHAICLDEMAKDGREIALIDEYAAADIAKGVVKSMGLKLSATQFLRAVSQRKCGGTAGETQLADEAFEAYCSELERRNTLDFDDLLLTSLKRWEPVQGGKAKTEYLLVDEFQDVSPIEYRLVRAWSRSCKGLFVIGDPDQSIYGFRGSDAACFDRLAQDEPQLRRITLLKNYRSTPEILQCALPVINHNPGGERRLEAQCGRGPAVQMVHAHSALSEAIYVAKQIGRIVGGIDMLAAQDMGHGIGTQRWGFSDIAVLYRTHRQADILEMCLQKEGIPYTVGGRDNFLADEKVRAAVSFFRFLIQPLETAELTYCLSAVWDCPRDLAASFANAWETAGQPDFAQRLEAVSARYAQGGKVSLCLKSLEKFYPRAAKEKPRRLLEEWMEDQGLRESKAFEKLLGTAVFHKTMPEFLQNLLLGREGDLMRSTAKRYSSGAVRLMTLHGAKGLEFPIVLLCGMTKGLLPLEGAANKIELAEERRLLYVGMTRASRQLILTGGEESSAFLQEIPAESLQNEDTQSPAQKAKQAQLSLF